MPVDTPSGSVTVSPGRSVTMATRRPDLQATDDLAQCRPASASSYVPRDEPVASVDGSTATHGWRPAGRPRSPFNWPAGRRSPR
jgi:hypothetical protein